MAYATSNQMKADAVRRTRIETTYEYVPLLGGVLGFWKRKHEHKLGSTLELHLSAPITEYDTLTINGKYIPIPKDEE